MTTRQLFPTHFYEDQLGDATLLAELDASCRQLAVDDRAGRAWAKAHGYRGYTSYASLDDLPQRDPAFATLKRRLDTHVADCDLRQCFEKDRLTTSMVLLLNTHSSLYGRNGMFGIPS